MDERLRATAGGRTKCLDRATFVLPELNPKLIYLDQLAISDLMKAI